MSWDTGLLRATGKPHAHLQNTSFVLIVSHENVVALTHTPTIISRLAYGTFAPGAGCKEAPGSAVECPVNDGERRGSEEGGPEHQSNIPEPGGPGNTKATATLQHN